MPEVRDYIMQLAGMEIEKNQDCGGESFSKLKYANSKEIKKNLEDDYGLGMIKNTIMLEVVLSLD